MGGIVSNDNTNRYDSVTEEFADELISNNANTNNNVQGRRRSRKLSLRNLDLKAGEDGVQTDRLAVPCGHRHPFADYRFNKKLGAGAFSMVYKATSVYNDSAVVAIKEVRLTGLNKEQLHDLQTEMNILSQLHHKNIVNLTAVFFVPDKIFLIMDYLRGGELLKAICKRNFYEERDAKRVLIQLADALRYIHARGVVHRDLKPENIILETKDFYSPIRLVDFGFAAVASEAQLRTKKFVKGTPGYMAPEVVLHGACVPAVDVWSLGVVLYILLSGTMPFDSKNKDSVLAGRYQYPDRLWSSVSMEAKDLIDKMLVVNPEGRITANEMFEHPWITSYYEDPLSGTIEQNYGKAEGQNSSTDVSSIAIQVAAKLDMEDRKLVHRRRSRSELDINSSSESGLTGDQSATNSSLDRDAQAGTIGRQHRSPSTLLHPIAEMSEQKDSARNSHVVSDSDSDSDQDENKKGHDGVKITNEQELQESKTVLYKQPNVLESDQREVKAVAEALPCECGANDAEFGATFTYETDADSLTPFTDRSPRTSGITQYTDRSARTSGTSIEAATPLTRSSPRSSIATNEFDPNQSQPPPGDLSRALIRLRNELGIRVLGQFGVALNRFKQAGRTRERRRNSDTSEMIALRRGDSASQGSTGITSGPSAHSSNAVGRSSSEKHDPDAIVPVTAVRSARSFSVSCVSEEAVDLAAILRKQSSFKSSQLGTDFQKSSEV